VFLRMLEVLKRDREIDVLSDELPLVAASMLEQGAGAITRDVAALLDAGARAHTWARMLQPEPGQARAMRMLAGEGLTVRLCAREPTLAAQEEDRAWDSLRLGWMCVVRHFEGTGREQSLDAFLQFVALATPTDLDSAGSERVSMMTVYGAKGHEWPVGFLIGVEDDEFPYSSSVMADEVEEGRRALYAGRTRSGKRLIMTHARRVGGKTRQPSQFLRDMRDHLDRKSIRTQGDAT
jgi:superfamily I DNA/RNA helicase